MIRFDGQAAVVTGAGRGLGRAYARLLAARGARVIVHDAGVALDGSGFDPSVADAVVAEIRAAEGMAEPHYAHLDSRQACEAVVGFALDRFARLDILIHSAAIVSYAPFEQLDLTLWERMLKVNVEAPFWLARAAVPAMRRQDYGRIILTISGVAMYPEAAMLGLTAYALGKAAQFGLMNALTAEVAGSDIRVNAVSPVAATRMLRRSAGPGELLPEQVAPGVAFLASSQCSLSGVVLRASGGHFSLGKYRFTQGIHLGSAPSPEDVAGRWSEIARESLSTA